MIAEVERGFYAVSFAGGQVDPATGDFVFGVSEGYLIEGGQGHPALPRRDPDRQLPRGAGGDRRRRQRLRDEDRRLRQGRPAGAGRDRPGPRPHPGDDGGGDGGLIELARRAVEAATAAGAERRRGLRGRGQRPRGARPRRRGREPQRRHPARHRHPRLDRQAGRLRLRHRSLRGGRDGAGARGPRRRPRVADEDEFAGPPDPSPRRPGRRRTGRGLSDPTLGEWSPRPARRSRPGDRVRRARGRLADRRGRAGRLRRFRRERRARLLTWDRGRVRELQLLRLRAGAGGGRGRPRDRARLRPRPRPGGPRPGGDRARGRRARARR